jgi:AraC-like DNA-binding protein
VSQGALDGPLQERVTSNCEQLRVVPREATVSIQVLHGLIEAVEMAGIPRSRLLRAAQLEPEHLSPADARMTRAAVFRLCELAMDLTADPALGLHWAERLSGNTFNPISHMIAHSATLRKAFESLTEFHRLLTDQPSFELLERGGSVTVRCMDLTGESLRTQRFAAEMLVIGILKLIRSFSMQARPRVSFEYPAPAYHSEYARVFEGAERFEQRFTGLVFDSALMNTPSPHKDDDVHGALRSIAERRVLQMTQSTPYAMRVRELLAQQTPSGRADMATVARSLGMSVRSLRRRLDEEGKTFDSIVNEALASTAKHLLRHTQRTIQEISYEMGFSDTSAFHRAFRRWTGMTPSAYRTEREA